ncbi:MAG: STAS domain-containing protein [Methylovulum sp.]|jgi:anti-sigma B factor antagonist|nr:STAS domain-containing protein [Methylovulum sp.]TSA39865.1 MAG: anti-sigma factor antagonist [Methylococcaceae bacterium]
MKLRYETKQEYEIVIIDEERIDAHNSGDLKEALLHKIEQGNTHLIVQLAQVRFIDSSGLGALLAAYKKINAGHGRLMLVHVQAQVLAMFELTRLTQVFDIYAELDDILAHHQ